MAATVLGAGSTLLATGAMAAWTFTAPAAVHVGASAQPAHVVAAAPAAAGTATRRPSCGPEPTNAAGWSALFESAQDQWSGGDGASSTRLPDGRLLWVFGDSFAGAVTSDGARGPGTRSSRNALVVTDGGCLTSVAPGRDAFRGRAGTWLWPTHSVVVRAGAETDVVVLAQRLARDPGDALGFARVGTALVHVTVPRGGVPRVGAVTDLPRGDVLWGAALADDGATTWVYGTRPSASGLGRDLLLARASTARVGDTRSWRYRTTTGWSDDPDDAAVVLAGSVSTVPSARASAGHVVLVTKPQEFLDDRVVALTAPHPWGPWSSRVLVRAPSSADDLAYSPAMVDVRRGASDIVLVNHTSTSLGVLMRHGHASDPRFYDVPRLAG